MSDRSKKSVLEGGHINLMAPAALMVGLLTCHWAWEHLTLYAPLVKAAVNTDASSWFLSNLSAVLFTCFVLAFSAKLEPYLRRRSAFYLAAACSFAGTIGLVASSLSPDRFGASDQFMGMLFGVSNLVVSFGVSLSIFLICAAFARVPSWSHELVISVATLTGLVAYVFVDSLPLVASSAIVILLPLGACFLYRAVDAGIVLKRSKGRAAAGKLGVPRWQLALLLVTSTSINYLRGTHAVDLTAGDQKAAFFALITLLVALSFVVIHFVRKRTGLSIKPAVVLALVLACVCLDVSSVEGALAQEVAVFAAFFLYVSYLYQVLATCAVSRTEGVFGALAVVSLFNQVGLVIGRVMADASIALSLGGTTDYLIITLLVVAVHLSTTVAYFFRAKKEKAAQEAEPEEPMLLIDADSITMKQVIVRNCRLVGEAHDLTPREIDVLVLLAEGKSLNGVAEGLGVSANTAKSHISRLYRKLDAHAKEDVLAIVVQADQIPAADYD